MSNHVVIIGAGPAGLSCALWLKHYGINPLIIEQSSLIGGMPATMSLPNHWLIGLYGKTSNEIAKLMEKHIEQEKIKVLTDTSVKHIRQTDTEFTLELNSNNTPNILAQKVVLATGTRIQTHEAFKETPGYQAIQNHVIFLPESHHYTNKHALAVIGGGDNAYESVIEACHTVKHVHLLIRSRTKARRTVIEEVSRLIQKGCVTVHQPADIQSFEKIEGKICIKLKQSSTLSSITVDAIISRTGVRPNTEAPLKWFGQLAQYIKQDANGYLITDANTATSLEGIYAIGDVANPDNPCVATAIAQGTIAARAIEQSLS